jgi:hypothetical protein
MQVTERVKGALAAAVFFFVWLFLWGAVAQTACHPALNAPRFNRAIGVREKES